MDVHDDAKRKVKGPVLHLDFLSQLVFPWILAIEQEQIELEAEGW